MRLEELANRLRQSPFEPFELCMSDGASYPITHPDQVLVTPRTVHVGIRNGARAPVVQEIVICDLGHVTRLTPLAKRRRTR